MTIVIIPDFNGSIAATCQTPATSGIKVQAGDCGVTVSLTEIKYCVPGLKIPEFHRLENNGSSHEQLYIQIF